MRLVTYYWGKLGKGHMESCIIFQNCKLIYNYLKKKKRRKKTNSRKKIHTAIIKRLRWRERRRPV